MKKLLALLLALVMCFSLFACNDSDRDDDRDDDDEWEDEDRDDEDEDDDDKSSGGLAQLFPDYNTRDLEDMLNYIETKYDEARTAIETETDTLVEELGDDYKNYDLDRVAEYHAAVYVHVENMWGSLENVCLDYYKCVAKQGLEDYDTWDSAMEDLGEVLEEAYYGIDSLWYDSYDVIYYACDDLIDFADADGVEESYDMWEEMFDEYCDACDAIDAMNYNSMQGYAETWSIIWDGFNEGEDDVDDILKAAEEELPSAMPAPEVEAPATAPVEEETIRREFADAMEEYLSFYESFCEVISLYSAYPDDEDIQGLYEEYLEISYEIDDTFFNWGAEAMNEAEYEYFNAVFETVMDMLEEAWG